MSKKESIIRYSLIVGKLRVNKQCSFEEIDNMLRLESELQGYNLSVSKRTFQRDLNDIRSIYNIDIKNNLSANKYYIADDYADENDISRRMLEAFDLFNSLNVAQNMQEIVSVESRKAIGVDQMYGLMHAIKNRQCISFLYYKYIEEKLTERKVEPLHLKEFKYRWYLIANEIKGKEKTMKTFALDRMSGFNILLEKFSFPVDIDFKKYFKDAFGIIRPDDEEPKKVVLSFDPYQGNYIKSLKLHHSQKVLENNEEEYRIELKVFITWDFIQELMMFANTFQVIEPLELKQELKRVCTEGLDLLNNE